LKKLRAVAGRCDPGEGRRNSFSGLVAGRPKMAICCVNEKIQTAHQPNTLRALDFFVSLHLTIFERPANFEFSTVKS
jgi:hypothetical protein